MDKQELIKQLSGVRFWRAQIEEHKEILRWLTDMNDLPGIQKQRDRISRDVARLVKSIDEANALIELVNSPRLRLLLTARYINGKTIERIAEEMDYTPRRVSDLHKSALQIILSNKTD